jgi:hypothetical protein
MWFVLYTEPDHSVWNDKHRRCSRKFRHIWDALMWAKTARAEGWRTTVISIPDCQESRELPR